MMIGRHRVRALTATLGLLATTALALVVPGTAHAGCVAGTEFTHSLTVNGTVYVTENPVNGTCNDNNYYQTYFTSQFAGWRASEHIQNDGEWESHYGGYDTNSYYLSYTDNNSHSLITLCLDNGSVWYCGWGSNYTYTSGFDHTYSGVNTGF
ncbi:hypothetical protein Daura_27310 [Dactylosporangium aurantiacum]|uniref:Secreted protein n=1 Tax=Dactylosporangium aurantiacum TaxID=35754 RepID=A0A9Q9I7G3_9ACTN|nr:hypothetical protein [Dactylosporangium aurantiacum]MDG6106424.1 hypothetical protein [Dactylosporangium aurantiacum]UWZ50536.1 hypothetical protein Daura_27310 [Dactylosporangium aurantiacum]